MFHWNHDSATKQTGREAARAVIENATVPTLPSIAEADQAEMTGFLAAMRPSADPGIGRMRAELLASGILVESGEGRPPWWRGAMSTAGGFGRKAPGPSRRSRRRNSREPAPGGFPGAGWKTE